jgi:hypothetical protein
MSGIGNIADITHLIAEVEQVAINQIKGDKRPAISKVYFAVDCGAADVHPYMTAVNRFKYFLLS